MYLSTHITEITQSPFCIPLQDLLDDHCACKLTDYVILSISEADSFTRISLTTTHSKPVTYTAMAPKADDLDLSTLLFMMGSD